MLDDYTKEQILKAYALSISGIAGEKEPAAKLLEELLRTHGVSMDDIMGNQRLIIGRLYEYSNEYELNLMIQLLESKFYEKHSYYVVFESQQLSVSLCENDHVVFDFLFGVYHRALERELKKVIKNFDLRVNSNSKKLEEVKKQYEKLKIKYMELMQVKDDDITTAFTAFICKNALFSPLRESNEGVANVKPSKDFLNKYKNMKVVPICDAIAEKDKQP